MSSDSSEITILHAACAVYRDRAERAEYSLANLRATGRNQAREQENERLHAEIGRLLTLLEMYRVVDRKDFWKRMTMRALCGCVASDCQTHGAADHDEAEFVRREGRR